jgi:phosphoenolpyruvate synthase/pyruvate phosphate dikinase
MNAQGEDVVAGVRTPQQIDQLARHHARGVQAVHRHLRHAREPLPRHAGHGVHH